MVEFRNVGEKAAVSGADVQKINSENKNTKDEKIVVIVANSPNNEGKGTSVQHSKGNPFYEEVDFEYFDGLGNSGMTQAYSATKRVQGELARLYNEVKRENPDAVENLEFPPLPSVPPKGKKALKMEAYLSALDQYRQTCEELLEGVNRQTVVNEVRGAAQDVKNTVVEMGTANLAATMNLGEAVLSGLQTIYNKIDTDTKVIISAVDKNGQKILRTIDKKTNEIKDLVMTEGQLTRDQEYLNSLVAEINNAKRFEKVHRHMDANDEWLEFKIDDAKDDINTHTTRDGDLTREKIDDLTARLFR